MKLYRTLNGIVVENGNAFSRIEADWDTLVCDADPIARVTEALRLGTPATDPLQDKAGNLLPPVGRQELWASGVTYKRSRSARMEESQQSGGDSFYDKVYRAERPELFFKAAPHRIAGHGGPVRIRRDSDWNVPEPELTLLLSPKGEVSGYTLGNDMSSRSIEGENPLYLPQAKSYEGSAAVGPCIWLSAEPPAPDTEISLQIRRSGKPVFEGSVALSQIKRRFEELAHWLYRELDFPYGCLLMTGTGIVPPNDFTLAPGDVIAISMPPIGTLENTVARS